MTEPVHKTGSWTFDPVYQKGQKPEYTGAEADRFGYVVCYDNGKVQVFNTLEQAREFAMNGYGSVYSANYGSPMVSFRRPEPSPTMKERIHKVIGQLYELLDDQ